MTKVFPWIFGNIEVFGNKVISYVRTSKLSLLRNNIWAESIPVLKCLMFSRWRNLFFNSCHYLLAVKTLITRNFFVFLIYTPILLETRSEFFFECFEYFGSLFRKLEPVLVLGYPCITIKAHHLILKETHKLGIADASVFEAKKKTLVLFKTIAICFHFMLLASFWLVRSQYQEVIDILYR